MTFETELRGETAWIRAHGDFDIATAPLIERSLLAAENQRGVTTVVLDLRPVQFLDSTGLRVVLAADARLRSHGRRLQIVRGPHAVHRVFELALLDERLAFRDDPETPFDEEPPHGRG